MKKGYLAFDFGASSGRLVLGMMSNGKLELQEVHRFPNEPVYANGTMYWDFLRLFHEMKQGLKKAATLKDVEIQAIGIDTWGVDGIWLDEKDQLIGSPIHYRDDRTSKIMDEFYTKITDEKLYELTGIQKTSFNTIYQLYYDKTKNEIIKNHGKTWLFMPDLFGFLLTGNKYNEYSIASTGALLDPVTKEYHLEVFETLGIPMEGMQKVVMPGTIVGMLTKEMQEETGLGEVAVVAVGSHDTASAVAATPLEGTEDIYLVCGTWCLMGMELQEPCITPETREYNFTNEGGIEGSIRLLKNINGLWFLQQLKKVWNEQGENIDFPDMIAAVKACDHEYRIDAADDRFMAPKNMAKEIIKNCEEKYGVTLEGIGAITKAAYNGLGELYKVTTEHFEKLTGKDVATIRMIGGGIKDEYLCQKVADVTGKRVVTGPIEASAIGNIMMQMKAVGDIATIAEGRDVIRKSFESKEYNKNA
ncbi:MAG: rhamnulokinase family protein [Cellulosilyticaceae bacterium]